MTYLDNCYEFKEERLDINKVETKLEKMVFKRKRTWTLDDAKKYYMKYDKDGERHSAVFVIKNNILPEYEEEAKNWKLPSRLLSKKVLMIWEKR